jgi:hypothetical protein
MREVVLVFTRIAALAAALALLLTVTGVSRAAEVVRHSGVIVDFDPGTDTIVLAELGPWTVRNGATVVTRQRIALTPDTAFRIAFRAEDAAEFPGQFVETPIDRAGVYVDDWVTVECRHEGSRMIAVSITVVDLPGGAYFLDNGR